MNVSKFRTNLKQCMDSALRGENVVIERGGVVYQLIADNVVPSVPSPYKSAIVKKDVAVERLKRHPAITTADKVLDKALDRVQYCEHGQPKGRCLWKSCKYA